MRPVASVLPLIRSRLHRHRVGQDRVLMPLLPVPLVGAHGFTLSLPGRRARSACCDQCAKRVPNEAGVRTGRSGGWVVG